MKPLSTYFILLIAILLVTNTSHSQNVIFKMKRPPLNQLKAADLWNATIINTGETFTAYLYGSMTNNDNGELIATGQTMNFEVKKGTTNFKVSDLPKIPDVNYVAKDEKYKKSFMNTGGAPPGNYKICVELRYANNTIAGDDCFEQKIIGGDAPQLISPRNEEEIKIDNPVFTWMHMKSPGSTQTYNIKIIEIKGDESPENAMLRNKAFFEKEGIATQMLQYPSSASKFEAGKKYAWQVSIGDLKSEVNIFERGDNFKNPPGINKSLPTYCDDFENNTIGNWITYSNDQGAISNTTNNLSNSNPGSSSTHGLHIVDVFGSTFIYDTVNFKGDYTQKLGSCFCFDFKLTTNLNGAYVHPRIYLVRGFNPSAPMAWGTNPVIAASFTAADSISQNSGWVHVCAPVQLCAGSSMPSNSHGTWQMMNNGTCSDWASFLPDVQGIMFSVDMSGWGGTEIFDIDNVCITNCDVPTSQGTNICDSLKASVSASPLQGCCWSLNITTPYNNSAIKGIQFLALSPNSFVTGSSSLGSAYNSGWIFPVNNGQEFKIKKLGGNIPAGQLNGFFNFCLNKLSSPQHVVVNWLSNSDSVICSDTVTTYCEIPCVTFTKDTLVCNGSNYDLHYSFTNNASFPIGKVDVVSSPAGITVFPQTQTLSPAINSGQTTNQPQFSVSGAVPNTQACFVLKFTSPDGCCWCYDTLCVNIPSCMCNEVGATITGDALNCCYSLNLQNNFSGNYFNQVNIRTLETGVTFNTWTTNTANNWYSTNIYPDNAIHLINNPASYPNNYIPSGNSTNVINFCMYGYTSATQHIIIEWMRNDSVKCRDTLATTCSPLPPQTNCTQVINDTLTCLPNGTYQYTFHVRNNSSHTTTGFQFNTVSYGSLTFTPANFSNVTIAPNMISSQQTMIISGVTPGSTFCYKISLYEHILQANQQYYDWCCYSDTICKTAPVCTNTTGCNCSNGKWDAVNNVIRYNSNGISTDNVINCNSSYTVDMGSSVSLFSKYICSTAGCAAKYTYKVNGGAMTGFQNSPFNIMNVTANTNVTIYAWCGDVICDSCKITIKPKETQSGCDCGEWKSKEISVNINDKEAHPMMCGDDLEIKLNDLLILNFPEYICKPKDCKASYSWDLKKESTVIRTDNDNPFKNKFNAAGLYTLTFKAYCGGKVCDSCIVHIKVIGKDVGDCNCGGWFKDKKGFTIHSSNGSPGVYFEKFIGCGENSTPINKGVVIDLVSQQYICKPEKNCTASYQWRITSPFGVNTTYNSQTVSGLALNETGLYTVYLAPSCGGKVCDECVSYLKVVKIDN